MPSSASTYGLELQQTGENSSTWGDKLNTVVELIEELIGGRNAFTLSGSKTLSNTNYVSNEARCGVQHITSGTGGTVTIPDLSRIYLFINDASGNVTVSASGGTDATVYPGERVIVVCTGTNVYRFTLLNMAGLALENLADPTDPQDAATKAYADALALDAAAGNLVPGSEGQFLRTVSGALVWATLTTAMISGFKAAASDIWTGTSESAAFTPDGTTDALAYVTLTPSGSTYTPDMTAGINFLMDNLSGSLTLANPSAVIPNRGGKIKLVWTGSGSITLGNAYYRRGGDATFSGANGQVDYLYYDPDSASFVLYDVITNPTNS